MEEKNVAPEEIDRRLEVREILEKLEDAPQRPTAEEATMTQLRTAIGKLKAMKRKLRTAAQKDTAHKVKRKAKNKQASASRKKNRR